MFGLDSLSRNAFIRKLPRTYKYMTEELKADVLQSYNIVGDGTPQALIPVRNVNFWNISQEFRYLNCNYFIYSSSPASLNWNYLRPGNESKIQVLLTRIHSYSTIMPKVAM